MMWNLRVSKRHQLGQAMVEMVAVGGLLVVLFLGIWYIGKFHDIQSSAIQAARYAAWERTARAPSMTAVQLESQTRARLFTWNQDAFKATDGKRNGDAWDNQSAHWQMHGTAKALVEQPDSVSVATTTGALPGAAVKPILLIMHASAPVPGGEALNYGGLYTSAVSVKLANVANLPAPLDTLNLTLHESSALVTDSWDASGAAQTAERTRASTLAGMLDKFTFLLKPLELVLSIIEPSILKFNPGQICPDVVPADRVTAGAGAKLQVYNGGGACS